MRTLSQRGIRTATVGIAMLLLGGLPVLAFPLAGASTPNPSAPPQQWAYGAQHWANASASTAVGQYQVSAFFGWTVVYTLTNTSNTSFELEAQRSMALDYSAQLCAPSCAHANASMDLAIHGREVETGFANFTTTATVNASGTTVAALGLVNSQAYASASLYESLNGSRTIAGVSHSGQLRLAVNGSAHSSVQFSTPLGLIPWALTNGTTWTSRSGFIASGGYDLHYVWSASNTNGSLNGSGTPSGSVNSSGVVTLAGADLGTLTLADGMTTPVIVLTWTTGTFVAVDGILLVPRGFEIFARGAHAWGAQAPGIQTVENSRIDVLLDLAHHRLRVAAAASTFSGSDTLGPSARGRVAVSADPSTPTAVQAQPMTVANAQSTSSCFTSHCSGASGNAALRPLVGVLVAGVVIAAVLGTVGVIGYRAMARRRVERLRVGIPADGHVPPAPPEGNSTAFVPPPPPPV